MSGITIISTLITLIAITTSIAIDIYNDIMSMYRKIEELKHEEEKYHEMWA